jgi:hypothetical protein
MDICHPFKLPHIRRLEVHIIPLIRIIILLITKREVELITMRVMEHIIILLITIMLTQQGMNLLML